MRRRTARGLPRALELRPAERGVLAGAFVLAVVFDAILGLTAVTGLGGRTGIAPLGPVAPVVIDVIPAVIVTLRAARVETKRGAWTWLAVGLWLYAAGTGLSCVYSVTGTVAPSPSLCDALWLSFYPCSYGAVVGLTTFRNRRRPAAGIWLDGVVAGAGLAAIGAAVAFPAVLRTAGGDQLKAAVLFAYPIGDLLLAGLVLGVVAVRGWRLDRGWAQLLGGFLVLAVADVLYAVQVSGGAADITAIAGFGYAVAFTLLAFSAWQVPPTRSERSASWSVLLVPTGFTLSACALLVYDRFHRVNGPAFALATVTLISAIGRMALAFRDARSLSEARRLAGTDDLTSLPNRRLFASRVEQAIATTRSEGGALAVMMLDLDNFKQLNDTLGHHAGDALLRTIGPRLEHALHGSHTVARLGGDEFAVLVHPAPDEAVLEKIAQRVLDGLREPVQVHGLALHVTGSIGIATFPADARDALELMRHADIALYQAKAARNRYDFYARERDTNSPERLALAAELALALEQGAIEVHFQPKAEPATRVIAGVEALVRWRRADGRLAGASEFVSAAEHAGLSRALTGRVLDLALQHARAWIEAGHHLHVSVNTTVADLLDAAFPAQVQDALVRHRVPAESVVLEITESSVLADPERITAVLGRLRRLGLSLSLDDFGTGYSSMAHLKALPVDELKIDRSFVGRMCSDATDSAIVFATIQLAQKLGIRVVAEGVEDRRTWDTLQSLGCDLIQGYLLSRPVPADDLTVQLDAQRARLESGSAGRAMAGAARSEHISAQPWDLLNAQRRTSGGLSAL